MNLLDLMAVLPLTSARSSLVLSLSIFSFQSFDRSFSMQEDSVEGKEEITALLYYFVIRTFFEVTGDFSLKKISNGRKNRSRTNISCIARRTQDKKKRKRTDRIIKCGCGSSSREMS